MDNCCYRNSVFYKGPLLPISSTIEENLPPVSFLTMRAYRNNVKSAILDAQKIGDKFQWENNNFILHNIKGLRRSNTEYRINVDYSEFWNWTAPKKELIKSSLWPKCVFVYFNLKIDFVSIKYQLIRYQIINLKTILFYIWYQ